MVQWIHSIMKVYRSGLAYYFTRMPGVQIVPSPLSLVKYGTKEGFQIGSSQKTKEKPYLVWYM